VSARRRNILFTFAVSVLLLALVSWRSTTSDPDGVTLRSGDKKYRVILATTQASQQLGLGKRVFLPKNQGMLFVFQEPALRCFWMKDMHFPLDMIWISSSQRIEDIQYNASPASYPKTFCPNVPAQYVLELNAGQAKISDMHIGQTLAF
jgi:uncharacterized membrane protein (UPF0127 family)